MITITKSAWKKLIHISSKIDNKSFLFGIKVRPIAEIYLLGTTIDYITQDYDKNIFESKFDFIIDKNLASTCGISFTPNNL